jgi:hypothetical protein
MKKLLLVAVGIMALSSFTTNKKTEDSVSLKYIVYFHCTDGHGYGSFYSNSSDPADWQAAANALCSI